MDGPRLEGTAVRLRPADEADLPHLVRWLNDPDVRHWQHRSEGGPETPASQSARLKLIREHPTDIFWHIDAADGTPLGNVGLVALDRVHGRAELYVFIGEKTYWSGGYGTDAIRVVLRHAFGDLGLRRVHLVVDADNARAIRCYEKCGFVREGTLREHRLRHGEPIDMITMAALRDDVLMQDDR